MHLLNKCEYSKMVLGKLGITDMTVPNLLGLTFRPSELEIRCDIIAQLVFHKQILLLDVLNKAMNGKYTAGLVGNNHCTNFAQNLLNRL
jgi:hypothetical protein